MTWTCRDYHCPACGAVFEQLETAPPRAKVPCLCGAQAELADAAPKIQEHSGKALYSFDHGPSQERPPWALDTRDQAEPRKRVLDEKTAKKLGLTK